jgi:type I restriction enzyme M protein
MIARPDSHAMDLDAKSLALFRAACEEEGEDPMVNLVEHVVELLAPGPHLSSNGFMDAVETDADKLNIKLTAARKKLLKDKLAKRDETAGEVISKIHKQGKVKPDSLRGLFEVTVARKPAIVEYDPDSDLRDTMQIPLLEKGGIEAFLRREIVPKAWRGMAPRASGPGLKSASPATSTSLSRSTRWRRFAPISWRCRRRPKGS